PIDPLPFIAAPLSFPPRRPSDLVRRDAQPLGDLLVRQAEADEREHLSLAVRQRFGVSLAAHGASILAPLRALCTTRKLCKARARSEEHTCELQSPDHLTCRLLL